MDTRTLGRTGLEVSPLGFGSAPVGYLGESQEEVTRVLSEFLDSGVNLVDTAACYPNSEELIGRAIADRRSEFLLVTKCGHQVDGITDPEWSAELIGKSIERSLRLLRTDHLDVVLLHSCNEGVLRKGEAMSALRIAQKAGKTRFLGYSGDNEAAAYAASLPEVTVLQTSINLCDQANIEGVLPVARANNVGVLAKRPLANAAWKAPALQRGIYQSYSEPYSKRLAAMHLDLGALGFHGSRDEEIHRIALRFTLSVPGVHCALTGTTKSANARSNIRVAREGPLPEKAFQAVRTAFIDARKKSSEKWPGLT